MLDDEYNFHDDELVSWLYIRTDCGEKIMAHIFVRCLPNLPN